jgi:F-type H+-transporting ATPase subunit b
MTIAILLQEGHAEGGGFNPLDLAQGGGLFWTVVIFVVALPFIWKLVMGPITRGLAERDEAASRAIKAAEEAKSGAEKARAEVEAQLAQARTQAGQLLDEARVRGETREREIIDTAKKESQALLERARTEIRAEQDRAISTIRKQVVDLSLAAAGQVLRRKVDAADDRRLAEELLANAGGTREGRK